MIEIPDWLLKRNDTPQENFERLVKNKPGSIFSVLIPGLCDDQDDLPLADQEICVFGLRTSLSLKSLVTISGQLYDGTIELVAMENITAEISGKSSASVHLETLEEVSTVQLKIYTTYYAIDAVKSLLYKKVPVELFGYAFYVASPSFFGTQWLKKNDLRKLYIADRVNIREYCRALYSPDDFKDKIEKIDFDITKNKVKNTIQKIFRCDFEFE